MSFPERRRRLVDASFETFGEEARWGFGADGAGSWMEETVRVRFKERDEDDGFGKVRLVTRSQIMRVRSWEVEQPDAENVVEIDAGPYAGTYYVKGRPMLDAKGVWECQVEKADA
jgi:hypothetical protein